jgi:hypothetical protein
MKDEHEIPLRRQLLGHDVLLGEFRRHLASSPSVGEWHWYHADSCNIGSRNITTFSSVMPMPRS